MSTQSDLQLIQNVIEQLDKNRAAVFSYTQSAFDSDDADGVDVFNRDAEQNIPKATLTDYNASVLTKGIRTQGASIPRSGWNHYIGRFSYNLNKLVQKLAVFFALNARTWAHNACEYDAAAHYAAGDVCYTIDTVNGVRTYTWYRRNNTTAPQNAGIPPTIALYWEEMQSRTSSSALLPFSAPGYRHKFSIVDLTGTQFNTSTWYPVTTAVQDFEAQTSGGKEGCLLTQIEAYCNGTVAGFSNPHRAELSILSKFTGFPSSSTDIILSVSFVDQTDGTDRPLESSPIGYSKLVKGRQAVLWLKGGTRYALWNSFGSNFTVHTFSYTNGIDGDAVTPLSSRNFSILAGVLYARTKVPGAVENDDAVNKGQMEGALPLPKELSSGANLDSVRSPGDYLAAGSNAANSAHNLPVANPGPFMLRVEGDKAGLQLTVQQLTVRATGNEYTRVLSGAAVMVPWYLSGSPNGTAVSVDGFIFRISNRRLLLFYWDGHGMPDMYIDAEKHLIWDFNIGGN